MPDMILIGCRLPHGVRLPALRKGDADVVLKGAYSHSSFNAASGALAPWAVGKTEIDAEYWAAFKEKYADWQPLKTGAIFEAKTEKAAEKQAQEMQDEKVGTERINPDELAKDRLQQIDPSTQKPIKTSA